MLFRSITFYFLFIFLIVALYGLAFSFNQAEPVDGKKMFIERKCSSCHNIESEGIIKKAGTNKNLTSDLSLIGGKLSKTQMAEFLTKKISLNNKKHPVEFKGNAEETDVLVKWLSGLKKTDSAKIKKSDTIKK